MYAPEGGAQSKKCLVTVTKAHVKGLTVDLFKKFRKQLFDASKNADESRERVTFVQLDSESVDGHQCYMTRMKMPPMFADRATINVYYDCTDGYGHYCCISSSLDTAHLEAANAERLKKYVIMTNYLNYTELREVKQADGSTLCHWTSITAHDMNGYANASLVKMEAERMRVQPRNLISYILTGKKPTQQE